MSGSSISVNVLWTLLEKIIRSFSVIAYLVIINTYFSIGEFGRLSYAISIQVIIYTMINFGLDRVFVKELSRCDEREYEKIVAFGFSLKLILVIFGLSVSYFFINKYSDGTETYFLICIFMGALIFKPANIIEHYLQSRMWTKPLSIVQIASTLLTLGLVTIFSIKQFEFKVIALAIALESLFIAIGYLYIYFKYLKSEKPIDRPQTPRREYYEAWLRDGFPLLLSSIGFVLLLRIDQIMIKHFLTDNDLGEYALAMRFSEAMILVPVVINSVTYPKIVKYVQENNNKINTILKRLLGGLYLYALVITIVASFSIDFVVELLVGDGHSNAIEVFKIHIWWVFFICSGLVTSSVLIAQGRQGIVLYRSVSALSINILLNFILIPKYGISGAAAASVVAYFVANFLLLGLIVKTRDLFVVVVHAFSPRWMIYSPVRMLKTSLGL